MAPSKVSTKEILDKYCRNGTLDPSISVKDARKLITPLVSHVFFSDGPVKWKNAPDYIRDPNNSSNQRPKPKEDELKAMLKRILEEYRARKREPDSSDVVDLHEQSEEIVNASSECLSPTAKDDDSEMFIDTFTDRISKLRDKNKEIMQWSRNRVAFDEQHETYLNWIGRFIDKLDLSDEEDPNMLSAIRWIEVVMKVYCKKNNMNSGSVENMESFVEHGKFEWTSIETDKVHRFGEPSSSIAEMYVNVQKPNPHGQYAVISQNSNTSKEDAISQQQPSNLANVFAIKSISAVDAMECHIAGDHTEEVVQSEDDGSLYQSPEDEMLAEDLIKEILNEKHRDKFKFEEDVEYEEDPRLGLYQDLRTDQLNSSNFPE